MICRLKDFERVFNLFTNEDLAGYITDDNSGDIFTVVKILLSNPSVIILMPSDETAFTFTCLNSILYEAHLVTTNYDKVNVYGNTLKAAQWLKDNTLAKQLISHIPTAERSTLYYSKKIGMRPLGFIPKAYLKNGEYLNVAVVGCSVDDIIRRLSWHQQ